MRQVQKSDRINSDRTGSPSPSRIDSDQLQYSLAKQNGGGLTKWRTSKENFNSVSLNP